jgi:hypothetical protein
MRSVLAPSSSTLSTVSDSGLADCHESATTLLKQRALSFLDNRLAAKSPPPDHRGGRESNPRTSVPV